MNELSSDEQNAYELYMREVEKEVEQETLAQDPIAQRCQYIEFESHSNGSGRPARKARTVQFIRIDGIYTYRVVNGEIKPSRHTEASPPDELVDILLECVPTNLRTLDLLLAKVVLVTQMRRQ